MGIPFSTNNVTDMFPPTVYDPSAYCMQKWGVKARPGWMKAEYWGKGMYYNKSRRRELVHKEMNGRVIKLVDLALYLEMFALALLERSGLHCTCSHLCEISISCMLDL